MRKPRNSRHSTFHEEPYVNDIGQTLQPGDRVVCFSRSWGIGRVSEGTYLGQRVGTGVNYSHERGKVTGLCVRVKRKGGAWFNDKGERCQWFKGAKLQQTEWEEGRCFVAKKVYAIR